MARRPAFSTLTAGLTAVLVATLLGDAPARADDEWEPPEPPEATEVPVAELPPTPHPDGPGESGPDAAVAGERPVDWPAAGAAVAELPDDSAAAAGVATPDGAPAPGRHGRAPAGDLPVRVGAAPLTRSQQDDVVGGVAQAQAATPGRVRVQVHSRAEATRAGVSGLLLDVARADGRALPARVAVEVSYAGFRHAYGGDWASRLRLSAVECAPRLRRCDPPRPLPTGHDRSAGVLAAEVPLPAGGEPTLLAVSAAPAGDNGDYTATSLSPAATWQVSQQTGDFSWSYPLRAVPGLGGPEPELALSYSSGSVDGRTASTNTQGSWIGDGWSLWPGFIERSYRPCLSDTDPVGGRAPNNADRETGDLCWFSDNATLSLNGRATELVRGSDGRYHGVADDGSRIELLTGGTGSGDNDGEYWKVTTTDGVQYFFGRHRPGGNQEATNSVWTAPVYGNHPGEPCHATGDFAGSRCAQAWRWNLDYVVDPSGNSMTLFYDWELGAYGRELDPAKRTHYRRGGYLTRIEYGTRAGQEAAGPAPARMVFDTANRCKPDTSCTRSNPSAWPDTPWDQFCDAAPCTDQLAPTFWTQKRLAKIRAQVRRGSGFSTVESWTLRHQYLDAGAQDGEGVPMWLSGITRTGHVTTAGGEAASDPEIEFHPGGKALPNRVDSPSDDRTALKRWRIHTITTESGAQIGVGYLDTECTRASLPTPHTNGKRCFPQWYAPPGAEPTLDWFHKYVVARVDVWDATGAGGHQQTTYQYLDDPAWHYDASELVPPDKRTWAQWRGYSKVRVRQGAAGTTQSRTDYLYFRGMHDDRAGPDPSDGRTRVPVTDSQGDSIDDHRAYQGFLREETVYNGDTWVSGSIHTPWRNGPTASAGPLHAFMTDTTTTRTRTALTGGEVRWTRTDTAFDDTYGMPVRQHDHGDLAVAGDSICTRWEHARNTTKWILDRVSRTEAVGVPCPEDPSRPDEVLSDQRTYYDDPDTHGAAPDRGLAVRTDEVGSWDGATPQWVTTSRTRYDRHGREVEVRDALDRRTRTSFTPETGGPVTRVTTTNPLGHTETSRLEPAWQLPTRTTDPNGHVTDLTYDGLGRLTGVWLPGRDRATDTADLRFDYLVRNDRPSAVTTETLLPTGSGYRTSITLLDGQLRERQTQTQAPGGGRVITDTVRDTRGLVAWQSRDYFNSGEPSATLVGTVGEPQIPGITEYRYDGAERKLAEIFLRNGQEAWQTSYEYGGDRVRTTPPAGGTATTVLTDARDRTVQRWQHHGPEASGDHDTTAYTYTKRGELASVTGPAGNTWSYRYDQRGRQVESVDPDRGRTVTSYDAAGQEITVTDARGVTLGYTYDDLGRRTSVREGSPTGPIRAEWIYDTLDNGIGKLTRSVRQVGGARYVSGVAGYDEAGRPTGTRVRIPESEEGLAGTYTTETSYRPDGSVSRTSLPELADGLPSEMLLYSYDDVGNPTTVTSGIWQYVSDVVYNKLSELTQRTLGPHFSRLAVTRSIDEPTGRLAGMSAVPELRPQVFDLAYEYDDAGNLRRIADSPSSATPEDTQCFRYDHLQRLTAAWTPAATGQDNCAAAPATGALGGPAPYWRSWTHDRTGNRTTQTAHGGAGDTVTTYAQDSASPHAVTRAATTGAASSSVSSYEYDPAGNLTVRSLPDRSQRLDYDLEGHLSTVTEDGATTSYVYGADGNRMVARDPDGATLYLPEGQELRWHRSTGTRTGTRYYAHGGATVAVRTGDGVSWLLGDHHGTAAAEVDADTLDAARRRTTPFGAPRGPEPGFWVGDKGFVGGTEDPTGLVHLGAREYDPQLGSFSTVDPVIDHDDPQQMHGYAYANNAPPSFTDPDGRRTRRKGSSGGKSAGGTVSGGGSTSAGGTVSGGGSTSAGGTIGTSASGTVGGKSVRGTIGTGTRGRILPPRLVLLEQGFPFGWLSSGQDPDEPLPDVVGRKPQPPSCEPGRGLGANAYCQGQWREYEEEMAAWEKRSRNPEKVAEYIRITEDPAAFEEERERPGSRFQWDWSNNSCSYSPDQPLGIGFGAACARHDFAYRNHERVGLSDDENRARVDRIFYREMLDVCGSYSGSAAASCGDVATTYYLMVRVLGGPAYGYP